MPVIDAAFAAELDDQRRIVRASACHGAPEG
jgi:hypothetical protein